MHTHESSIKVIVVGMNPSVLPNGPVLRKNYTIDRLYKWMSHVRINCFSFTNCVHDTGEVSLKDVDYDLLRGCIQGYDRVIALGGFASSALKKLNINHFKLPHPSPRNRALNDKSYEIKMLELCDNYIWN